MAMLILGLVLLVLKFAEIGPVADWSWVWVILPFGLAVLWWGFADSTGLTQRRAIAKMERRKEERRLRDMEALGLNAHRDKQARRARDAVRRAAAHRSSAPADDERREPRP